MKLNDNITNPINFYITNSTDRTLTSSELSDLADTDIAVSSDTRFSKLLIWNTEFIFTLSFLIESINTSFTVSLISNIIGPFPDTTNDIFSRV